MFDRIIANPAILSGKPCIHGTRLSVEFILDLLASGASAPQIVAGYPQLTSSDVEQAIRYAAKGLRNEVVQTLEVGR